MQSAFRFQIFLRRDVIRAVWSIVLGRAAGKLSAGALGTVLPIFQQKVLFSSCRLFAADAQSSLSDNLHGRKRFLQATQRSMWLHQVKQGQLSTGKHTRKPVRRKGMHCTMKHIALKAVIEPTACNAYVRSAYQLYCSTCWIQRR